MVALLLDLLGQQSDLHSAGGELYPKSFAKWGPATEASQGGAAPKHLIGGLWPVETEAVSAPSL